jgi:hypothetical protein
MAALYFISFNLLKLQMPSFQNDIRVPFWGIFASGSNPLKKSPRPPGAMLLTWGSPPLNAVALTK